MLQNRKLYYLFLFLWIGQSCIEPYSITLPSEETNLYVVSCNLTDQEGWQTVSISTTSPLDSLDFKPLKNCLVIISDDLGHRFSLIENIPGNYRVMMQKKDLNPGTSYKVDIITPSGEEITSAYDKMPYGPAVDSVYYIRKDLPTSNINDVIPGIQFYLNLRAGESDSRFYRWELEETWEHHAMYPVTWYWDHGTIYHVVPADSSRFVCYSTGKIPGVYTLSVQNLQAKSYRFFPLHFVDNTSQRLAFHYSLLVRQYGISEEAYNYWDALRGNETTGTGLYQKQPAQVQGNLRNITHPGNKVLGFFSATSLRTKRIFVDNVPDLPFNFDYFCGVPQAPYPPDFVDGEITYLIHYKGSEGAGTYVISHTCVDCTFIGGTTVKPDFWPY